MCWGRDQLSGLAFGKVNLAAGCWMESGVGSLCELKTARRELRLLNMFACLFF